jgi:glutathione S-transferase
MKLYINTTSPFVRLVRIAIAEKGLSGRIATEIVNPWSDDANLLNRNSAGRVPTLITEDGTTLSEAQFILRYLDSVAPAPAVFPAADLVPILAIAAIALGAIEAAVAIIIGRKSSERFDTDLVGSKRYRTMESAFKALENNLPSNFADRPDIANIAAITAIDYIEFRFQNRDWLEGLPKLKAWRDRQHQRESVVSTKPYV